LRRALHFRPRDAQILNNLACALERQGQWSQANSRSVSASRS
jgi:Flp pilus assembly protein TadD